VQSTSTNSDPFGFDIANNVKPASATVGAEKNQIDDTAIIKGNGASDVYDLQAELEKKFDELFGNTTTNASTY
jgi:hypothetical protein